jgi:hypothetical protein
MMFRYKGCSATQGRTLINTGNKISVSTHYYHRSSIADGAETARVTLTTAIGFTNDKFRSRKNNLNLKPVSVVALLFSLVKQITLSELLKNSVSCP